MRKENQMKKRFFHILLLICVSVILSACGAATQQQSLRPAATSAPASESAPTPTPPNVVSSLPGSDLQPTATPEPTEAPPAVDVARLEAARACIELDVSVLYAAIGEPYDSSYVPSCLGIDRDAEDGELYYEGFTVLTYREGEKEIVWDVIVNAG